MTKLEAQLKANGLHGDHVGAPLSLEAFRATRKEVEDCSELFGSEEATPGYTYANGSCCIMLDPDGVPFLVIFNKQHIGILPDLEAILYRDFYLPEIAGVKAADPAPADPVETITPTYNTGDMMNCCRGDHDFSDEAPICRVCGVEEEAAPVAATTTPSAAATLAFVEQMARLSASGDATDPDGDECPNGYDHDTGSSLDALDEMIHKARRLIGAE